MTLRDPNQSFFRVVAHVLLPLQLSVGVPAARTATAAPLQGPQREDKTPPAASRPGGNSNRKLPAVKPPSLALQFSETPTDREFLRARVFPESLVPVGAETTPDENRALAQAITSYAASSSREDVSPFERFLEAHPQTAWRASVLANLGLVYRKTGYLTKALKAGQEAWDLAQKARDARGRATADIALGELMELHARLGHVSELEALFAAIEGRELSGPPSSKVEGARQALAILRSQPEYAYRCGPLAVSKLVSLEGMTPERRRKIDAAVSTLNGTTLTSNERLARGLGLKFRMAKRESSQAPILVPAVVHWKAGHFAALVREEGGRYLAQDPTFGDEIWLSRKALEDEASGYFLVKDGDLPAGWRRVDAREGDSVWGKGYPSSSDPGDQSPQDPQVCGPCPSGGGMATYTFHHMLASLRITDTPVGYSPPRGPAVQFNATYLQREQFLPTIPYFSTLGPKWTFEWLSFIEDAPDDPIQKLSLFVRGGGRESYTHSSTQGGVSTFGPYFKNAAVVKRVSTNPIRYEKHLPDGSVEVYAQPDSTFSVTRRVLLTESTDPQGNTVRFVYDETLRLIAVSDAIGQVTTLFYELPSDPLKITRVTDPFGRSAKVDYDSSGRLIRITDVIDLASEFRYGDSYSDFDFIRAMTTPYGTTTFTADEHVQEFTFPGEETPLLNYNRFIEATDPLGGKERLEFWNGAEFVYPLPDTDPIHPVGFTDSHLFAGVSIYWSKLAMAQGAGDALKAEVTNWVWDMHKGPNRSVPMATKRPFESRVWHKYPGQVILRDLPTLAKPTGTARILEGGATQLTQNEYNQSGKVCKTVDPNGRETKYTYGTNNVADATCTTGSGLDLLKVEQKNGGSYDTLASYDYNTMHQPLTVKDAAGQTTTYTYNAAGQVLTVTTPPRANITENRTTTYAYDSDGYLQNVLGPAPGAATLYTYDGYGRVKTVTDSESYTVTTQYDAMDRPVKVTYPDGTTEETVYNRLDAERHKDRMGRWTQTLHDALRRVTSIRDPLGRTTQQVWCSCGSLEKIIDPNGNETRWERDVQGRVTKEIRADNTFTSFTYDETSRLKTRTDAKGQVTNYTYNADDNLTLISYTNETISTPDVSFFYDTPYNRIKTMTDGTGLTTYNYYPSTGLGANKLQSVDGPLTNDLVSYTYDELGRIMTRGLTQGTPFVSTLNYDVLGRLGSLVSPVGTFTWTYATTTGRPLTVVYPNSQKTTYDYFDNLGDHRLKQIKHEQTAGGAVLSKFDYTYDAVGNIKTWTQLLSPNPAKVYDFGYDVADQLTAARLSSVGPPQTLLKRYIWTYDPAGNRTGEQIDDAPTAATHNNRNQLLSRQAGGDMLFRGTTNEPAKVTVQSKPAAVDSTNTFQSEAQVTSGTTDVVVQATDYATVPNTRTNTYRVNVSGSPASYTYDPNGNMASKTEGGVTTTYDWDAENKLTAVKQGAVTIASFVYDGNGRRCQKSAAGVSRTYLYDSEDIIEERISSGQTYRNVHGPWTDQLFAQRDQGNVVTYSVADHLGNVVQTTSSAGAIALTREFDPWGNLIQGSSTGGYAFTGREWDPEVGLHYYRARFYDSGVGRFMSPDPTGTKADLNLYRYVGNGPLRRRDPYGLYQRDVHFDLTLYLGERAGCTKGEAGVIAQADQSVDDNPSTSPFTGGTGVRKDFHFVTPQQLAKLRAEAFECKDYQHSVKMGTYLHAFQDSFSHVNAQGDPYGAGAGHMFDGTWPDIPNNRPTRWAQMMMATLSELRAFCNMCACP